VNKFLNILRNAWKTPDLRAKVVFTLLLLTIYRIIAHIPIPGVNFEALKNLFAQNQFLGLLNMFSGGALANFSIIALGLNPYINSSIIFQLLGMVFPKIEEMQKEGESGMRKINQYTRILTVPLAAIQSISIYFLLRSQGIIQGLKVSELAILIITLTTGAVLLVWLGELITEYGIGNGISFLIFAGILSGMPISITQIAVTQTGEGFFNLILFAALALLVIGGIVLVNEAQRQIPIQYARRVRGTRQYGGGTTHLPLRLNQAGVIPIIFAISLMLIPGMVANFIVNSGINMPRVINIAQFISDLFTHDNLFYAAFYFILVLAFTYFYTAVTFNPEKIAENLQKNGGFIPGIRPGRITANYLNWILTRITLPGAIFLGVIAVLPMLTRFAFPTMGNVLSLGGTSILIVVSVVLETVKSMEAMMLMRSYEGFLE